MLGQKLIVAHRGLSGSEPENTLEAFAASVARGVEAFEFDVRQTGDGVLVLCHGSTAGGQAIAQSTYAGLMARVPGLCTLDEALEAIPSGCLIDVEIKVPGIEARVLQELELRRQTGDFVVTSFHDGVVAGVKALDPTVQTGLILGEGRPKQGIRARLSEFFPRGRLRRSRSDFVVPSWKLLRFGFLRRSRRLGYPAWVWTVDEPGLMKRVLQHPAVAAVVTDRPLEAMALRAGLQ